MLFLIDWCTFPWWLPWIIPFLLGLLLGWLIWGRFKRLLEQSEKNLEDCRKKRSQLEEDLAECRKSYNALDSENAALRGSIREYRERVEELEKEIEEKDAESGPSDQDTEDRMASGLESPIALAPQGDSDVEQGDQQEDGEPELGTDEDDDGNSNDGDIEALGAFNLQDEAEDMTIVSELDENVESVPHMELTDLDAEADVTPDEVSELRDDVQSEMGTTGSDTIGLNREQPMHSVESEIEDQPAPTGDLPGTNHTSNLADQAISSLGTLGVAAVAGDQVSIGSKDMFDVLKEDNLQIIEGVGPKMAAVLNENHISTWGDLAGKTSDGLRQILSSEQYGRKYQIIDPESWPQQAALANQGNWDRLIAMQKDLNSRLVSSRSNTDSKVEKVLIKLGALRKYQKDDLKIIEGIGPKIETLMHNAGIRSWAALAGSSTERLQEILDQAGDRFRLADPTTWARQAGLAEAGNWKELEDYQELLQGGRE